MARSFQHLEITGTKKIMRRLNRLSTTHRNRVLRPAVNAALTPFRRAAAAKAPVRQLKYTPPGVIPGTLKKSLTKKVKVFRSSGTVLGLMGPSKARARTFITPAGPILVDPARYAHLVEFGHGGPRPARAYPFMRPAYDSQRSAAQAILAAKLRSGIRRLAKSV